LERELQTGCRVQLTSYSDWCTYNEVFADGEYDSGIELAMALFKDGSVFRVVDLGANIGLFTLRVMELMRRRAARRATFLLVEPSRALAGRLEATFKAVDASDVQVRIVRGLVGQRTGVGHLRIAHEQIKNAVTLHPGSTTERVNYIDLERELEPDAEIDLLKCDIEGSEGSLIDNYGAVLERTRVAMFEFHEPHCSIHAAKAKLGAAGLGSATCLKDEGKYQTWRFERAT
jgi:FkbM family methyltransferase